jgi:hypothetical protein
VKLEFSSHAKEQLKRRRVSQKKVLKTVDNPDKVLPSYKNREIYRKVFEEKILEVVVINEDNIFVVITAYYLDI